MTFDEAMEILAYADDPVSRHAPFPHCDMYVLHEPGKCSVCDHYKVYQALRVAWRIKFTDQRLTLDMWEPEWKFILPCPAELRRPVETMHQWYGNTPHKEQA